MADEDEDDTRAEEALSELLDDEESEEDDVEEAESEDTQGDAKQLGDAGKRALDAMKKERNSARKELNDVRAKLKDYEDKDKSESQRLQEAAEDAKSRAQKAETLYQRFQVAMDRAPDHASLTQIRAVAKRLSGESEEDLESDADELYELVAPAPAAEPDEADTKRSLPSKPRENLRGGGDPEDEPEETDPDKLADLIGRH
jgi:hypothetical protein